MLEQSTSTPKERFYGIFGRPAHEVSASLNQAYENANPGEKVKPHRHGTHQITYVLRGELRYGNRVTSAGMGYYSPDTPYAWTAGDDGAEWIEIHAGQPQAYAE
jgi:hypothetical protein